MNSIRKIKKLTARYPIVIEIHMPMLMCQQQMQDVRNRLKQEFGSGIIIMMFHVPDEPVGLLKMPEISGEDKQKFITAIENHNSFFTRPIISNSSSNVEIIFKQKTFIHSVFALSKKQHKELSDRLEKHLIAINPKN